MRWPEPEPGITRKTRSAAPRCLIPNAFAAEPVAAPPHIQTTHRAANHLQATARAGDGAGDELQAGGHGGDGIRGPPLRARARTASVRKPGSGSVSLLPHRPPTEPVHCNGPQLAVSGLLSKEVASQYLAAMPSRRQLWTMLT